MLNEHSPVDDVQAFLYWGVCKQADGWYHASSENCWCTSSRNLPYHCITCSIIKHRLKYMYSCTLLMGKMAICIAKFCLL